MMSRIHSLTSRFIFFTVALLLCCAPLAPARSDEPHWIRVNSSHFSVVTDADESKGHDVAARFEQMRACSANCWREPDQHVGTDRHHRPEDDDEYSKMVPNRQGQAIGSGFFIPGEDRDYFVLNLSKEESWRAVSHEFALVFLNYNYPPTQPWFDEGFAEYFSSLRFDNKQAQIGGDPDRPLKSLTRRRGFGSRICSPLPATPLRKARTNLVLRAIVDRDALPVAPGQALGDWDVFRPGREPEALGRGSDSESVRHELSPVGAGG